MFKNHDMIYYVEFLILFYNGKLKYYFKFTYFSPCSYLTRVGVSSINLKSIPPPFFSQLEKLPQCK